MKLELGVSRTLMEPDAETIARSLAELDWKEDIFAKLSRDKLNYIQTTGTHGEGFIVEYQDGGEDRFFQAVSKVNLEAVKSFFVAYSRGDNSWQSSVGWRKVDVRSGGGRLRSLRTLITVVLLIAFLLFLAFMSLRAKLPHLAH
jgi:hypothetical protein